MKNVPCVFLLPLLFAAATTQPASQPATTTAPSLDRSSPEKTWASTCAALKNADLAGFRGSFFNGNEVSQLFMDAFSDAAVATFDLSKAVTILGDDGAKLAKSLEKTYNDMVKSGEGRTLATKGDQATWTRREVTPRGTVEEVVYFKLVKGEWLIDTIKTYHLDSDGGRDQAEEMIASTPKLTATLKQITEEIRARKITSVEQMRQRMTALSK